MEKGNRIGVLFLLLILAVSVLGAFSVLSSPNISGKVIIAEAIPIANGTIIIDEGTYTEFDGSKIQIASDGQDRKSLLLPIYWVYLLLGLIVVAIVVLLLLIFVIPKMKSVKKPESNAPVRANIPKVISKSNEYNRIVNLVASANDDLDNGNLENAKTDYNNIEILFKSLSYPEKKELYEMARTLHERITLVLKNAKNVNPVAAVPQNTPATPSKPIVKEHDDGNGTYYSSMSGQ